jgi:creatinine amidohydrolase/Fe(II)-dependent formamide hydrolase-like protein
MRTHIYNKMTAQEIEEYLASGKDTIVIAAGPTEIHGESPVDIENAFAQMNALAIAEEVDALALINLPYIYPGGTAIGRSTVWTTELQNYDYSFHICKSLVDQGFKKILIVPGHGAFWLPFFLRDFFEETGIHPVEVHVRTQLPSDPETEGSPATMDKYLDATAMTMIKQQHKNLRIDPNVTTQKGEVIANDPRLREFADTVRPFGGVAALAFMDRRQHGGGYIYKSEEEMQKYAEIGEKLLREATARQDFQGLLKALEDFQAYAAQLVKKNPGIRL